MFLCSSKKGFPVARLVELTPKALEGLDSEKLKSIYSFEIARILGGCLCWNAYISPSHTTHKDESGNGHLFQVPNRLTVTTEPRRCEMQGKGDRKKWKSFGDRTSAQLLSIGTLVHLAKKNGYASTKTKARTYPESISLSYSLFRK